jgi:hypothetical protein
MMMAVSGRTSACYMSTAMCRGLARPPSRMRVIVGEGIGPGRFVRHPPSCGVQADVDENRARSQRQVGDNRNSSIVQMATVSLPLLTVKGLAVLPPSRMAGAGTL